jgi:hypothetical protein
MATVYAPRLCRSGGVLSWIPHRDAELHKRQRGSERGNAVFRLYPHPAECGIGSPLIEVLRWSVESEH